VPAAGTGFSPLDVELGLLPNHRFTPRVEEILARLGTALAFAEAADVLHLALGVSVSVATARRCTYAAGAAAVAVEEAARQRVERALPPAPVSPERLQLSLDATTVPLVGGAWTEVKLAVFADLAPGAPADDGRPALAATNLSYVARWEPAERFAQTLTLEAHRRGVDVARLVVSPNDGAEWIQGGLDLVAPRAVRVLDEPHAAEHLRVIGDLVHGEGTLAARTWMADQRRRLHEEPAAGVVADMARCLGRGPHPSAPAGPGGETPEHLLGREVAYFQKRADQIQYAAFRRAGYPIGSGIVESGHKVVVGARLKGAGRHWAAHHLTPLLVLRTTVCNERWAEQWPHIWAEQRRQATAARHAARRPRPAAPDGGATGQTTTAAPPDRAAPASPPPPKRVVNGRPTADHPWRRSSPVPARRLAG
jgi:hypothetical protein